MNRYTHHARWYDALSAEPVYRAGRRCAVPALGLRPGDRVLDVGCGTGLDFPLLLDAVGETGQVVGVDRSLEMLQVAERRAGGRPPGNLVLLEADARQLDETVLSSSGTRGDFDALLFTYSLSLMHDWPRAWRAASALVRDGGRAAVVDMQVPVGWGKVLSPPARLACLLGGADINARPWTGLEQDAEDVRSWSLRGGHVQVRVGTLRRSRS